MAGKLLQSIDDHEFYAKYAAHAGKDVNGVPIEDRELLSAGVDGNTLTLEATTGSTAVNVVPSPEAPDLVLKSTGEGQYAWSASSEYPGEGRLKLGLGTDAPEFTGFDANSSEDVTVTIPGATRKKFGVMSPEDKAKLDGMASGATRVEFLDTTKNGQIAVNGIDSTVYTHPTPMQSIVPPGLYKFKADKMGHIQEVYKVNKEDIVALGIPAQDTTYENLPEAEGGEDVSLVSTGDKYGWNRKYAKPTAGIPASDLSDQVNASLGKADTAYQKPAGGIPESDLGNSARAKLDGAIQGVAIGDDDPIPPDANNVVRLPRESVVNDGKLSMILGTSAAQQIFSANESNDVSFSVPLASMDNSGSSPVYTEGLVGRAMYEKVDGIEDGAQENLIEEIKVNGTTQPITNKSIDIDLGTWTSGTYNIPAVATP